jgi:hypothetical protein
MRRTDILENKVLPLVSEKLEKELVKKWWEGHWTKIAKIAGWLSAIGGFIIIVLEIISKL